MHSLKATGFEAIQRALKKKGIQSPERKVIVFPPANVWRHLAKFDKQFRHRREQHPQLWVALPQARLRLEWRTSCMAAGASRAHRFWRSRIQQVGWELFTWKNEGTQDGIYGVLTCHVDDLAIAGEQKWLDGLHDRMVKKFKKVSRQVQPFEHCGAEYSKTKQGYCISQKAFVDRMKPADIPSRSEESDLTPDEVTSFRSILGALLWLTSTRLDLIAEVSFFAEQGDICQSTWP